MKALLFAMAVLVAPARAELVHVDLELVLAVDTSRSMDRDELRIQRQGYVLALEHPAVTSAFQMGPLGRVALTFMEWGGPFHSKVLVDWTLIESREDALAFAMELRKAPINNLRGTSISHAMIRAKEMIETNQFEGTRKVIDISGDGPNNRGRPVVETRDEVAAAGIEINGLPFMVKRASGLFSIPDLDIYYEDCVITGDSAFVIPISRMDKLVASIRQKLVLEISGFQPERPARLRKVARIDCLIGEKLRARQWQE